MPISREHNTASVTILAAAALSEAIDMRRSSGAILRMPAAWTAASIGFLTCQTGTGTFQPLYDDLGNLVQISGVAASRDIKLPDDVFASHYVQLWSQNGAGVDVVQAADRAIVVMLKG